MKCPECNRVLKDGKDNRFFCVNIKCDVILVHVEYREKRKGVKE